MCALVIEEFNNRSLGVLRACPRSGWIALQVRLLDTDGFSGAILSDPAKPVPYTEDVHFSRTRDYMTDDQRFASRRPDVLTFETEILENDLTLGGTVIADLLTSISTTDADFVVKLNGGGSLLVEIKGQIGEAMIKKAAAERWCRAVTNDGRFGTWSYQLCFGAQELKKVLDAVVAESARVTA